MELSDFNKKLARTFVKDFDIPIYVVSEARFFYMLYSLGYEQKWRFFVNTLNSFPGTFESQTDRFFAERDRIRDEIVKEITTRHEYQEFNTRDMNIYKSADIQVSKDKIYPRYISVDLKHANIQALHYANPKITLGENTWDGFVRRINGHNPMSEYAIASKRFRQVVLGMLNPKRAITVEKHMMSLICAVVKKYDPSSDLIAFNNDELVFGFATPKRDDFKEYLRDTIERELGFLVHVKMYSKKTLRLRNLSSYDLTQKFDLITYDDGSVNTKGVPGYLYAIVHMLLRGKSVNNNHKHFLNDNMDCLITDDFILCDENGEEINKIMIKNEN